MKKILMLLLFSSFLVGCAINGRQITLSPVQTQLKLDASGQTVFVNVVDKREEGLKPNEVGAVKNGYYITMSHVWANKDAAIWIHETIVEELKRLGANIAEKDGDPAVSRVDIDVTICWCSAYLTYNGDVAVIVNLKKDGKELIKNKEYIGKGGNGINFVAASDGYQKSLETAMLDMLQKLLPDIINSLKA